MTITARDLTTGEVAGSGFYDELQRTSKSHLLEEYDAGRIAGTDYSNIYLGVMQSNLQSAIQFVLQREMTNQQILSLQEQVLQAKKQNELLELQKISLDLQNQTSRYNLEVTMPAQYIGLLEQNKAAAEATNNASLQGELLVKQNLQATAQLELTAKQEDMVDKQILTESANTSLPTAGITKAQYDKLGVELDLLKQKRETELAQTSDVLSNGTTVVSGSIAKDKALKQSQSESFTRDAEQKAAKFYSDAFSIIYSTDKDAITDQTDWGLNSANSKVVMNKLIAGIDIT